MNRAALRRRLGETTGYTVTRHPVPGTIEHHLGLLFSRLALDLLIDVGGHSGEFGYMARRSGFDGLIVSYEPAPTDTLRQAVENDERWHLVEAAASTNHGNAVLHRYEASDFNSLQAASPAMTRFNVGSVHDDLEVRTVRLDDPDQTRLTGDHIFLKSDAQGHDLQVIEGAAGLLDRVQVIQMELAVTAIYEGVPLMPEVVAHLLDLGYEPTGFFPVSHARDHLRVIEFDGVFVRPQRSVE